MAKESKPTLTIIRRNEVEARTGLSRSMRCPDKIGQSRIKQPEQFSNTSC